MKKALISAVLVVSAAWASCLEHAIDVPEETSNVAKAFTSPIFWHIWDEMLSHELARWTPADNDEALEWQSQFRNDTFVCLFSMWSSNVRLRLHCPAQQKKIAWPCRFPRASFVVQLSGNLAPLKSTLRFSIEIKIRGEMHMKFLSIYKNVERNTPPSQEEMARMGKLIEDSMKAGKLLGTEGCLPSALGARVRITDGKFTVTDGPFTEAKEVVGGFAILQANSKQEAIEMTKEFLEVVGQGECELRQIFEANAAQAQSAKS